MIKLLHWYFGPRARRGQVICLFQLPFADVNLAWRHSIEPFKCALLILSSRVLVLTYLCFIWYVLRKVFSFLIKPYADVDYFMLKSVLQSNGFSLSSGCFVSVRVLSHGLIHYKFWLSKAVCHPLPTELFFSLHNVPEQKSSHPCGD